MDEKKLKNIRYYKSAIWTIILVAVVSVINAFLMAYADTYFVFSSYFVNAVTVTIVGMGSQYVFIAVVAAIILVVPYIIFAVFAPRNYGFMIAAVVVFGLDTLFVGIDLILGTTDLMVDFIVHVVVLVELILGVVNKDAVKVMKELKATKKYGNGQPAGAPVSVTQDGGNQQTAAMPSAESTVDNTAEQTEIVADDEGDKATEVTDSFFTGNAGYDNGGSLIDSTTRTVTIKRKKLFAASLVKAEVYIDGYEIAVLKNGAEASTQVSGGKHTMIVQVKNARMAVEIPQGLSDKTYVLKIGASVNGATVKVSEEVEKPTAKLY